MVLGQVLMPVLPAVWETTADRFGTGWAYAVLAALPALAAMCAAPVLLRRGTAARTDLAPT